MRPEAGQPDQARRLIAYTGAIGGKIAAAEFMNEPDLAAMGGAPAGYDADAYGRDFKRFRSLIKRTTPDTMILGPGTIGDAATASRLLAASGRRPGWVFLSLLRRAVGAMPRQRHAGSRAFARLALGHRSCAGFEQGASRPLRARQADLAHGDRGCRLRRQSVGGDLSGYIPLSRSAWTAGASGRASRHAQHAGGERLWLAR